MKPELEKSSLKYKDTPREAGKVACAERRKNWKDTYKRQGL